MFTVLAEKGLPRPGMVFGIDAEFVALSRPDKILQGCAPGHPCVHPCAAAFVAFGSFACRSKLSYSPLAYVHLSAHRLLL